MNVIGSNKIRVASKGNKFSIENVDSNFVEFELVDWKDKNGEIPMPVKELIILSSFKQEGNTCKFDVNTENKLGKFILNIKYKGNLVCSKDITVVSLW
jgi:hypothetical protein